MIDENGVLITKFGLINQAEKKRGDKEIFYISYSLAAINVFDRKERRMNHTGLLCHHQVSKQERKKINNMLTHVYEYHVANLKANDFPESLSWKRGQRWEGESVILVTTS